MINDPDSTLLLTLQNQFMMIIIQFVTDFDPGIVYLMVKIYLERRMKQIILTLVNIFISI